MISVCKAEPEAIGLMPRASPSGLVWTIRSSPNLRAVSSRKMIISRNFHVVSTWSSGSGGLAGWNALRARCSRTLESLPIEYISTGLRNSAATSRRIAIDSASRRRKCCGSAPPDGETVADASMASLNSNPLYWSAPRRALDGSAPLVLQRFANSFEQQVFVERLRHVRDYARGDRPLPLPARRASCYQDCRNSATLGDQAVMQSHSGHARHPHVED